MTDRSATELARVDSETSANPVTEWFAPCLPSNLQELVNEGGDYSALPVISAEDFAILEAAMQTAKPDITPCPVEKIEEMMATTALIHPDAKLTDRDQIIRLRAYVRTLKDLPADVLGQAFADCAKEIAFFPKVAEIRDRAQRILKKRWKVYNRMATLAMKHRHEYLPPPADDGVPATPEEREEFNLMMRKMGLKTRAFSNGECRPLEEGEDDPAPRPPEPPLEGSAEEPVLPL